MMLSSDEIQKIIPHRYPFLLIDKVIEMEEGKSCTAIKCVSANEPQFTGHFPNMHIMPGVLMVEALAQTGAVLLLSMKQFKGKTAFFAGIKNCKFKRKVIPGDALTLQVILTKIHGEIGIGEAVATVDGEVAVKATLTFAIG